MISADLIVAVVGSYIDKAERLLSDTNESFPVANHVDSFASSELLQTDKVEPLFADTDESIALSRL